MNFKPLNDRLLVKRVEEEEKTEGGIIIPETAKEKPLQGKVLAVGTGRTNEDGSARPLEVQVGDVVMFGKFGGTDIEIEGEEHTILREDDVLGIVEE
ncbi:MAG: co-chaperone GroES [Myxococcota bacterium]